MNGMPRRGTHRFGYRRLVPLGHLVVYLSQIALLPALMLGGIGDVFSAIWDKAASVPGIIKDYVESAISTFWNWLWENAVLPVYQAIRGVAGAIWETLNQFMKDVGGTFWTIFGKIEEAVSRAIGWASQNILYWYGQAKDLITGAAGWLTGQVGELWGNVRSMADTIYHQFVEPIWHHLEGLPGWINDNLIQPAIHAIGDLGGIAWRAVEPILRPYISWIDATKKIVGDAWDMVTKLWNALWPIVSDPQGWLVNHMSWLFGRNGGNMVDRLVKAMGDNADAFEDVLVRWLG